MFKNITERWIMEWLKRIRETLNATQQEVADYAGIAQASYCNIERGRRLPSIETAKKIGRYFGFDWAKFFDFDICENRGNE